MKLRYIRRRFEITLLWREEKMKKIAFVFSCLFILLGLITIITTSILNELIPKLGYMAFQAAAAGSYSPDSYEMQFSCANFLAFIMIASGAVGYVTIFLSLRNK